MDKNNCGKPRFDERVELSKLLFRNFDLLFNSGEVVDDSLLFGRTMEWDRQFAVILEVDMGYGRTGETVSKMKRPYKMKKIVAVDAFAGDKRLHGSED